MLVRQKTLIILAVFLLAPISSAVDNPILETEDQRESAALNWHALEPTQTVQTSLKSLDFTINLESFSFDPLLDEIPKSRLDDSNDYRVTGMAIIQLKHHTGEALLNIVEEYNLFILDNLGSSN